MCFQHRKCFTLCKPVDSDKKLKRLHELEWEELDPEFLHNAILLRTYLLNSLKPIHLNDTVLDGEMIVNYVDNLVNQINNGVLPNLE